MTISRRHIAAAALLASGASVLAHSPVFAETADDTAVANAVAALTKAMLAADKAGLEALVADQLSYGHSGGVVQPDFRVNAPRRAAHENHDPRAILNNCLCLLCRRPRTIGAA